MTEFSRVVKLYSGLKEQMPDEQLLLVCKEKSGCVRISDVLAQFKYCINHEKGSENSNIIRSYLIGVFSEEIVHGLEEL